MATWTDIPSTDVDIDSPIDTDLMSAIRNNHRALRMDVLGVYFAATAITSAGFTAAVTTNIYVPDLPDYTGLQRKLTASFDAKADSSGDQIQLRLSGYGTHSSVVTVTSLMYTLVTLDIDISSSYTGGAYQVKIEGKAVTGSGWIRSLNLVAWRLEY